MGVRVARTLVFYVVFFRSLFVFCLFFFDLQILITPLVYLQTILVKIMSLPVYVILVEVDSLELLVSKTGQIERHVSWNEFVSGEIYLFFFFPFTFLLCFPLDLFHLSGFIL